MMRYAIRSLEAALEAWGGRRDRGCREHLGGDALREARRLLEQCPWAAKSAFSALIKIGDLAETCDTEAEDAIRVAERAVRDVVVMRCQPQDKPADRSAFLLNAEEACGQPLSRELVATLLLAYQKICRYPVQAQRRVRAKVKAKATGVA